MADYTVILLAEGAVDVMELMEKGTNHVFLSKEDLLIQVVEFENNLLINRVPNTQRFA